MDHKAQFLDLSCSWYTSMTCPQEFPLQYTFLPMIGYCTVIEDQQDAASLQTDLNHLQELEREWQMVFNPDKCEHFRITNKRKVIQTSYNIHGQTLNETSKAMYLGVIQTILCPGTAISTVTKKANQTKAFPVEIFRAVQRMSRSNATSQ